MAAIPTFEDMANHKLITAYRNDPISFYHVMECVPDILDTVNIFKEIFIEHDTAEALYIEFKNKYNTYLGGDIILKSNKPEYLFNIKINEDIVNYLKLFNQYNLYKIPSWLIVDDLIKLMEPDQFPSPMIPLVFPSMELWHNYVKALWHYTAYYGRYRWLEYGRKDIEDLFLLPKSGCNESYSITNNSKAYLPRIEVCDTKKVLNIKKQFNSILFKLSTNIDFNDSTGYL